MPLGAIPTVRTERLQLMSFADRHIDAYAHLVSDPNNMNYIGNGKPLDPTAAWLDMAMWLGHWHLRGYGMWAVEEASSGQLIGRAGLFQPFGWADAEVSWLIGYGHRGRGFGTEVGQAV